MIVRSRCPAPRVFVQLCVLGWATLASRATLGEKTTAPLTAATAAARPLRLVPLHDGPPVWESGRLRDALESELQGPVALDEELGVSADAGVVTIVYRTAGNELTVTYSPREGDTVTRTISPPGAGADVADVTPWAVLLAGNVVRDQAGELLGPPTRPSGRIATAAAATQLPTVASVRATAPVADVPSWLFELMESVRVEPVVWSANLTLVNAALKFSGPFSYALLGASGHRETGRQLIGPSLALGAGTPFFFNLPIACESDIGVTYLRSVDQPSVPPDTFVYTATRLISRLRTSVVFSPHPHVALFAGVALTLTTHFYAVASNDFAPELFAGVRL